MKRYTRFIKNFDWPIFMATVLLLGFGVSIIYSTTYTTETKGMDAFEHLGYGIFGLITIFLLAKMDYRLLKSYSGVLYLVTVTMLVAVQVIGVTTLGATRWINLGFFQFQPSELAKLFMIIVMAKFFAERAETIRNLKTLLLSLFFIAVPTALVLAQPDLGTAITFIVIWVSMVVISNAKKIYLFGLTLIGLCSLPVVYQFLADYQKARILTFFNPASDPLGGGWNVNQAMIAIGSGQWLGRGLGHGPQSQLNFLPFKQTDFAFAALAEEMGFIGAGFVIILFGVILYRALRTSRLARDFFGTYLAIGIFAVIFFHVFINIGMNLGIMPVTGIPLPLISAGGTSVVVTLAMIGILESIILRYKKIDF